MTLAGSNLATYYQETSTITGGMMMSMMRGGVLQAREPIQSTIREGRQDGASQRDARQRDRPGSENITSTIFRRNSTR
jgi:hypothetical protein